MHGDGHRFVARWPDALILHRDVVDPRGDFLTDFGRFAIYAHVSGLDQRLRGAPGADASIGNIFLETDFGGFQASGVGCK
jgi:hypothetical protein